MIYYQSPSRVLSNVIQHDYPSELDTMLHMISLARIHANFRIRNILMEDTGGKLQHEIPSSKRENTSALVRI
jgi:hypothetical protein